MFTLLKSSLVLGAALESCTQVFVSAAPDKMPRSWGSTDKKGRAYLREKRDQEGVVALPSGLMYKVITKGSGDTHPFPDTPCDCHYRGTTIDGKEFDSSYNRGEPTSFAPNQVIGGWTEAMQLMVEGDKWELYIPAKMAYGESGAGADIPAKAALIFTMEIVKVKGPGKKAETVEL